MADDDSDPASAGASDGDRERAREERAAARRQLLDFEPGNVRDLDAAAACECSCHPRPGQTDKHSGDLCSCQWTNCDRAMHLAEFNSIFEEQRLEVEALQRGTCVRLTSTRGAHPQAPASSWFAAVTHPTCSPASG